MTELDRKELQAYSHLELIAKQVVEGFITGLHKSPFHGFSVEFAEHRLYNTGESTRHLDWKLFARTDKLFVKRYEEETNLRCSLILDVSSSMNFPENLPKGKYNKLQFSITAAAVLIEMLRKQRDAFGLSCFSDRIETHTDVKSSRTHQRLVYHELENLLARPPQEGKSTAVVEMLHHLAEMIHKRSLVIIFSDMLDRSDKEEELLSALQHLRHNKHEVILFHVADHHTELDFDFENRPYRFVDMESGEEVKLNPSEVKEAYVAQARKQEKELRLKCGQYGIDFVSVDVGKEFQQILLPFLAKRKKMF
jgi:uncharacterized protein (DUF58 family)